MGSMTLKELELALGANASMFVSYFDGAWTVSVQPDKGDVVIARGVRLDTAVQAALGELLQRRRGAPEMH